MIVQQASLTQTTTVCGVIVTVVKIIGVEYLPSQVLIHLFSLSMWKLESIMAWERESITITTHAKRPD